MRQFTDYNNHFVFLEHWIKSCMQYGFKRDCNSLNVVSEYHCQVCSTVAYSEGPGYIYSPVMDYPKVFMVFLRSSRQNARIVP